MPTPRKLNLPASWDRMGWTNKAGYLCSTHQARDYPDACSILAGMRRPKPCTPVQQVVASLEQRKLF